ncbi:hypothetical protein [Escherichia coli]|uniref:hypothetical protein n=1 Tax=Escherichia coli TaxID=562 RepID=UPI003EEF15A6
MLCGCATYQLVDIVIISIVVFDAYFGERLWGVGEARTHQPAVVKVNDDGMIRPTGEVAAGEKLFSAKMKFHCCGKTETYGLS